MLSWVAQTSKAAFCQSTRQACAQSTRIVPARLFRTNAILSREPQHYYNDWAWLSTEGQAAAARKTGNKPEPTLEEAWKQQEYLHVQFLRPPPGPYAGRTVPVLSNNFATAYSDLSQLLRHNKVQSELRLTKRHERKGDKRRRLKSERWRRLFAHMVRQKVQLVKEIRTYGA
ncbi:bacterial ribosomal protein bS21 family protein [Abortiporus biennis]